MKILITGASSGLGAELARQYASKDNTLILLARREDKLKKLQEELTPLSQAVKIIVADLSDFDTLQKKIEILGFVDMVILNAGISIGHSEELTSFANFKKLYDVNVLSQHAILEVLLPKFVEQKSGKIVFISSLASLITMPTSKAYSSTKRAINAYAEGIRYKYNSKGIKVINILPGFIVSEMTDKNNFTMPFLLSTQKGVQRIKKAIDSNKRIYAFPKRFYFLIQLLNFLPKILREKIVNSVQ